MDECPVCEEEKELTERCDHCDEDVCKDCIVVEEEDQRSCRSCLGY